MGTLFDKPLILVEQADRRATLQRLRANGINPTTRGRGRCSIYVNATWTACVIARRQETAKGTRWAFARHGRLSRAAIRFLHEQLTTG